MTYIGSMRNVHDYDLVCVCVFWGGGGVYKISPTDNRIMNTFFLLLIEVLLRAC